MKKINISLIIVAFVVCFLFANLGKNVEIADCNLVSGIFIDKKQDEWFLEFEIIKPSKDDAFASKSETVKVNGYTLKQAFETAKEQSKKQLFHQSTRIYVVSDSLCGNEELYEFFLKDDVNMRAVAIYCQGSAAEILKDENNEAESVFISDKIKRYCFENKKPVPKVRSLLKNSNSIYLTDKLTVQEVKL